MADEVTAVTTEKRMGKKRGRGRIDHGPKDEKWGGAASVCDPMSSLSVQQRHACTFESFHKNSHDRWHLLLPAEEAPPQKKRCRRGSSGPASTTDDCLNQRHDAERGCTLPRRRRQAVPSPSTRRSDRVGMHALEAGCGRSREFGADAQLLKLLPREPPNSFQSATYAASASAAAAASSALPSSTSASHSSLAWSRRNSAALSAASRSSSSSPPSSVRRTRQRVLRGVATNSRRPAAAVLDDVGVRRHPNRDPLGDLLKAELAVVVEVALGEPAPPRRARRLLAQLGPLPRLARQRRHHLAPPRPACRRLAERRAKASWSCSNDRLTEASTSSSSTYCVSIITSCVSASAERSASSIAQGAARGSDAGWYFLGHR